MYRLFCIYKICDLAEITANLPFSYRTMNLIPVLDLKDGQLVHARQGQRNEYRAINSSLCNGAVPEDFVQMFVEIFSANYLYIADLDAISNFGNNFYCVESIVKQYPDLTVYLDAGIKLLDEKPLQLTNCVPVIGSENQISSKQLESYKRKHSDLILSLDFNTNGFWGKEELFNSYAVWPERIIIMNLDCVGSNQGLNLQRLEKIQILSPRSKIFFAGGVQNSKDLTLLEQHGVHAVLLASSLHNGSIDANLFKSMNTG